MKILLTHTPHMRDNYYGARALAGLQALGDVVLHQGRETLEGPALIAAAGFIFISRGDWRRLLACLGGFLLARLCVTRLSRQP